MARGRAYGESRIVCGVHNACAVEAGRTTALSTVAAKHGQAGFMADVAMARPQGCEAEARLVAQPIL
ncbi:hypothetical protein ACVWZA_003578 [Sphingomonas sp. UYAg733]